LSTAPATVQPTYVAPAPVYMAPAQVVIVPPATTSTYTTTETYPGPDGQPTGSRATVSRNENDVTAQVTTQVTTYPNPVVTTAPVLVTPPSTTTVTVTPLH
jgi:hypothetical protein